MRIQILDISFEKRLCSKCWLFIVEVMDMSMHAVLTKNHFIHTSFLRPKCHIMFLDESLNGADGVIKNIVSNLEQGALRMHAYLKCLPPGYKMRDFHIAGKK